MDPYLDKILSDISYHLKRVADELERIRLNEVVISADEFNKNVAKKLVKDGDKEQQ